MQRLPAWEAAPSGNLESVAVYERPAEFHGRAGGLVIVLNGPSSVGKSYLMRAFADRATTPFACLDEPLIGWLPGVFVAWPETVGPHEDGVLAALAAAAAARNQFLVSAAGIAQQRFRDALGDVHTLYVGLDAPLEELVRRQRLQSDKFGGLAERSTDIHEGWDYDIWVDRAELGIDAAADLLAGRLGVDLLPPRMR